MIIFYTVGVNKHPLPIGKLYLSSESFNTISVPFDTATSAISFPFFSFCPWLFMSSNTYIGTETAVFTGGNF